MHLIMSSDFFRVNMPYGMKKREDGKWMLFNRHYKPLGYTCYIDEKDEFYHRYPDLNEQLLKKLSIDKDDVTRRDKIWFYDDATNPSGLTLDKDLWEEYQAKLALLANLKCE